MHVDRVLKCSKETSERALASNRDWCKWIFIVVEFLLTARRRSIRRVPIAEKELKAESVQEILARLDLYMYIDKIDSMWKFIIFLGSKQNNRKRKYK